MKKTAALLSTDSSNITILGRNAKSSPNIKLSEVFVKYQGSDSFNTVLSGNFVFIPNLSKAFVITQPTFFKITFQGCIYNGGQYLQQFVQIIINDYLILANKLVPNTVQRVNYGLGLALNDVDTIGGIYFATNQYYSITPITRIAHVYLPAGTYIFGVGTRNDRNTGEIRGGIVTYESTQFENDRLQQVGDYKLAIFPN
ncbi:unnamed protein product [Rotaria socialis]|uniref:Uncharacterized protein n=1 Tax=Rotaria socialis TaxID=392032 RepID=A0A820NXU6_9BILA|nr:unnamed protein product [Rotaria socialis]